MSILVLFFFGLALACKVSALFILPLILVLLFLPLFEKHLEFHHRKIFLTIGKKRLGLDLLLSLFLFLSFLLTSYITIRIADPYLFETPDILHPQISSLFIQNIKELKSWEGADVSFPPAIQWISKPPIIFNLVNTTLYGFGIFPFLFMLWGIVIVKKSWKHPQLLILLLWTICFFLYQSTQFVKTMRYFLFLYPVFALFAGIGAAHILKRLRMYSLPLFLLCLIWPLAFFSIYLHTTTRITASRWMYENIPNGTLVLTEHWDDPLPLLLPEYADTSIPGEQLPVFDPDSPEKFAKIDELMKKSNYIILSSNRGWGSIPTVPKKYPKMTKFYEDLFAGKTGYHLIKKITSYPSLRYLTIPIDFPDTNAEEAFTVYDHPTVLIFKRP